jgi:hypothetical protein
VPRVAGFHVDELSRSAQQESRIDCKLSPGRSIMRSTLTLVFAPLVCLMLVLAGCDSSSDSGGGGSSIAPDCSSGTEAGEFDSDVPSWIQDNFICVKVTVDGDDLVITTKNLPPYTDYYYAEDSEYADRHDSAGVPITPNPNEISEQDVTVTVPSDPQMAGTTTETELGPVGIAVDGVVIYNNSANPPDVLADEADTMDQNNGGHPDQFGMYHYHFEPPRLSDDDEVLIGIAADGLPIYGKRNEDGSVAFDAGGAEEYAGDNCHDTDHDGVPHYHAVSNTQQQDEEGDYLEIAYLVGTNYCGTPGSIEWTQ